MTSQFQTSDRKDLWVLGGRTSSKSNLPGPFNRKVPSEENFPESRHGAELSRPQKSNLLESLKQVLTPGRLEKYNQIQAQIRQRANRGHKT